MERYLCIHGQFYQPPRENPWLEAIEIQDSASPYHDWNEKVTAECYGPNTASRILDGERRIIDIVGNYARISFNFGPTLLSWMESNARETYMAVLDADRKSIEQRSGHGNAIAQAYNHMIMPLANRRDKRTQVIWGMRDFEHRFGRPPEGMWLPETAVDIETLETLAEFGVRFTILAPRQARQVRKAGVGKWKDVGGGRIDPSRPYVCRLPSGRRINIFFYDGPISGAVAFEKLLSSGESFAERLLSGFSDLRQWPQMLSIATDGETYGHHHKFGDMALAYALNFIEHNGLAKITNYGEYLERFPPTHEVRIGENTSWRCIHGIERWRGDCGCNSGGRPGWNQGWRAPLRQALDWLREQLSFKFRHKAGEYLKDPWKARDGYIDVLLDRSEGNVSSFLKDHALGGLSREERVIVLKLLESQRCAMLMYTSCGWFFDELSGMETVQVLQYAGRAIRLSEDLFHDGLEDSFRARLSEAKSNLPEYGDGARIYDAFVKPAFLDLKKVAVHYAVSSLFEDYPDESAIFSYGVRREDYRRLEAGRIKLATGRISVASRITAEEERISFCVLHLGDHALNGGVSTYRGHEAYQSMKKETGEAFERGALADLVRLMDLHFGMHNYSLIHLFRDEQRRVLEFLVGEKIGPFVYTYRNLYDDNRRLMEFLLAAGAPVPRAFRSAAEFIIAIDLRRAFLEEEVDAELVQKLISEMKKWNIVPDPADGESVIRRRFEGMVDRLRENPSDLALLLQVRKMLELLRSMPFEIDYWRAQNTYYEMAKTSFRDFLLKDRTGSEDASRWTAAFSEIGEMLFFNTASILPRV